MNKITDLIRTLTLAGIAGVVLYLAITPGTILNNRQTGDEIRRERARLMVEISRIDDPTQRQLALSALSLGYEADPDGLFTAVHRLMTVQGHIALIARRTDALDETPDASVSACDGIGRHLDELISELVRTAHDYPEAADLQRAALEIEREAERLENRAREACS